MSWILLIFGIALWWAAHLFKRIAPNTRAALGTTGWRLVAVAVLISVALMTLGFRATPFVHVWSPPAYLTHANNLLVLVAIFFFTPAAKRGVILNGVRHPMLTGFALWAVAHLLVNGDLASILLFGGLLLWVPVSKLATNRAEGPWVARPRGTIIWDGAFLLASVIALWVVGQIHTWLGYSPFG
ncbi:NnrU family protein [Phaeobacter italicus]|jgi:uncharacterized membrane protein|uniref:NnrU family protein n=1 Tax=Rhodobacterales TaxID=204455 RepID=UPI001868717F|nr:NnrU family protein [Phycobacter azelaicus]MBE1297034.1 hypothetical protein [Paracoccaceae bacterium]